MADDAIATIQATVLPDEIAKTISATTTVTPADSGDKWYYKLTSVSNASTDLIAGAFLDYTAVDDDTAPTAVATGDKIKFLFIKNVDGNSRSIYVTLDGTTATSSVAGAVIIGPNESFVGRLATDTTVANVNAISSASTAEVIVAALLDDVA